MNRLVYRVYASSKTVESILHDKPEKEEVERNLEIIIGDNLVNRNMVKQTEAQ